MKKTLMILSTIAFSVVTGILIAFQYMDYKGIAFAEEPKTAEDISSKKIHEYTIHLEEITTNLHENGSYISLSLSVLATSKKSAEELSLREFQLKDYIIKELSSTTSEQIKSQEGTKAFLEKVKHYANKISNKDLVLEVYMTNKMISR